MGGFRVERDGAHRSADFGAIDDELEGDHQQCRHHDDEDLVAGDDEAAEGVIGRGEDGGKGAGRGAEEDLTGVFEKQGHADGGDEDVERGGSAERAVGEALDNHAEEGAAEHGGEQDDETAPHGIFGDEFAEIVTDEGADHKDV